MLAKTTMTQDNLLNGLLTLHVFTQDAMPLFHRPAGVQAPVTVRSVELPEAGQQETAARYACMQHGTLVTVLFNMHA